MRSNLSLIMRGSRACIWVAVLLLVPAGSVLASTITLDSGTDATGNVQWNSVGGSGTANVNISPNPGWATPPAGVSWVSYAVTNLTGPVNSGTFGALGATPTASFYQLFDLPFNINSGGITVYADDTAAVFVDSVQVFAASTASAGSACVSSPIGCSTGNGAFIDLSGLSTGSHELRFDVWQLSTDTAFGLMYSGSIESIEGVPEPATFGLLGIGLLALAGFRRSRNKA